MHEDQASPATGRSPSAGIIGNCGSLLLFLAVSCAAGVAGWWLLAGYLNLEANPTLRLGLAVWAGLATFLMSGVVWLSVRWFWMGRRRRIPGAWTLNELEFLAKRIEHEGQLINHRVTWLLLGNGVLFTAVAFAWERSVVLTGLLAGLGSLTALTAWNGLLCAAVAIKKLHYDWECKKSENLPMVMGLHLEHRVQELALPWFILPAMLCATWVLLGALCVPNGPLKDLRDLRISRGDQATNVVVVLHSPTSAAVLDGGALIGSVLKTLTNNQLTNVIVIQGSGGGGTK